MRLVFSLFLIASSLFPSAAYAHQVIADKNISVLLHMEPGDDPAAHEPARLYFYLKDNDRRFDKAYCDCEVRIERGGEELLRVKLGPDYIPENYGDNVWEIPFTFPDRDVYQVYIKGAAREGRFADFSIPYDVRIEREVDPPQPSLGITPIVIGVIMVGIVAFFIIKKKIL